MITKVIDWELVDEVLYMRDGKTQYKTGRKKIKVTIPDNIWHIDLDSECPLPDGDLYYIEYKILGWDINERILYCPTNNTVYGSNSNITYILAEIKTQINLAKNQYNEINSVLKDLIK